MPEGVPKIIKSWVVDPFYDESIQINKFRIENEIQIGLNLRQGRFKHFFDQYTYCPMVIEGDMKRFDQNANSSIITLAFSIIRSCYPQGKKWDLIFAYIMSGDLHKNICTPDGEVYKISKGIPTGSPFTTVLGCVVNWIAWTTTFSKLGFSPEDYRLVCYGDDMLCGLLKYNYEITPEIICKTMLDCCGFTVSPCKVFDMFGLDGLDDQPSLLKTYSLFGLPARKFEDIMERPLFSDIRGINRFDHAMRITGSFYNAPFNFEAMRVLSIFRVFLYKSARNSFPLNSKYYDNRFLSINAFYTSLKAGVASFYDISKNASKSSGLPWLNKSKFVSSVIKRRTHDPGVQLIRDLFGVLNKKKSDRLVDYQCGILDSFRGNCYYRLE